MKQYKLIKTYPGSPALGSTVIGEYDNNVAKYPEFWEEVVEKDYEILSISNSYKSIYVLESDGMYHYHNYPGKSDQNLTVSKDKLKIYGSGFKIHSVKRLSDGEIFTVGDKVRYKFNKKSISKIITKIAVEKVGNCPEKLFIYTDGEQSTINNYVKAEEPLFKTVDGVGIYEGDCFYCVGQNYFIHPVEACKGMYYSYNYFSTKKAAKEYIIMNKPCLSIKDCLSLTSWFNMEEDLKELVRTKIGKL